MRSLDATGRTKSSDIKGGDKPKEGIYFVVVAEMKYIDKDGGYELPILVVLGGTTHDQKGKQLPLFMKSDDNGNFGDVHHRFALASRLLEPGKKTGEIDFTFWKQAEGRYLVVSADADDSGEVWIGNYGLDIWGPHESDLPAKLSDMDGDVVAIFAQVGTGQPAASTSPAVQGSDSQIASPNGNGESVSDVDEWEGI